MAAVGHYHCHRVHDGITDWGDALFDIQYVGASLILADGHVMIHHMFTNSHADVKRTVFTGMLDLPRMLRIPVYTIQKYLQFVTGMLLRYKDIATDNTKTYNGWGYLKHTSYLFVRILLIVEMFYAFWIGRYWLWTIQFILTVWWNLFMIVSSHDFEESETKAEIKHG